LEDSSIASLRFGATPCIREKARVCAGRGGEGVGVGLGGERREREGKETREWGGGGRAEGVGGWMEARKGECECGGEKEKRMRLC
jgi:hypothetical protein